MRYYVDEKAICPICFTQFNQRLRCIAHLSDMRRAKCREAIFAQHIPPLSGDVVQQLDAEDALLRKQARRLGHTTPIAEGAARRSNGKQVGHASH